MDTYYYDGPVYIFEQCVCSKWYGETRATTAGRALSNLKYQYKKSRNLIPNAKVELPGEVYCIGGTNNGR